MALFNSEDCERKEFNKQGEYENKRNVANVHNYDDDDDD